MRGNRNCKKAFTLLELSIVIALVAVVSVVAIGVCTLVSNITYENTVKNEIIQETTLLKTQVENNIDQITTYNEQIAVNDLGFGEYNRIDKVKFDNIDIGNKSLIKCTITLNCDYPFSENNEFIFTVTKEIGNA